MNTKQAGKVDVISAYEKNMHKVSSEFNHPNQASVICSVKYSGQQIAQQSAVSCTECCTG